MKILGMIGGTTWHSTIDYYRYINQLVNDVTGNGTNPELILFNLNQRQIFQLQDSGRWDEVAHILADSAARLRKAGADGIILCANTLHRVYEEVSKELDIPVLHIADAAAREIKAHGFIRAGLIGTIYTMNGDYISGRLREKYGIEVITPDEEDKEKLHKIVDEEMGKGIFSECSRNFAIEVIERLKSRGAQTVILGCTEFPILMRDINLDIPLLDTTLLHSRMAADFILE